MRMVCEEVRQLVVYIIREVKLGKFLKQSSVTDSVERLREVERQNDDVWFSGQQINNSI